MAGNQSIELSEQYVITPKTLLYDNNLTPLQRLIMIELLALSHRKGYAFCQNSRLSKLFEVSTVSISQNIKKLEEKGYIECSYEKEKSYSNRTITIKPNFKGIEQETYKDEFKPPLSEVKAPLNETLSTFKPSFKHNIKSNNKTNIKSNIKKNIKKENPNLDEKVETLRKIFLEYYSPISSRFTKSEVKQQLKSKIKEFDEIEKGFRNYLEEQYSKKSELKYIKATHRFINKEMYKDYLDKDYEPAEDDATYITVDQYIKGDY